MSKRESMRTAVIYRTRAKSLKPEREWHNYGEPDQVQFELCEFSDGRVAQRWRIGAGSCVWWDNLEALFSVPVTASATDGWGCLW